ncbi:hypothetical protein RHGRI_007714 [Rhododendron griersonianum]|uniref:PB1-like domain-containing protein n=1 Tax=Rhododendron griersonianum TaxID=479676 RepID=A0AAV6L0T3_9ERIC|nr:hypothetical protein RHGRI_007714 [Rhododendron griersonianum]
MTTYATLQLHHGGYFKHNPLATIYLGGTVEMVDEIDPDLICFFDLNKVIMSYGYPTTSTIYYVIPSVGLTKGLRVINSFIEVKEMLDFYKGLQVISFDCERGHEPLQIIYPDDDVDVPPVETNVVHLDDESHKANEGNYEVVDDIPVDKGVGEDEDEEDDPDYEVDEDEENEDDEDGSDVSSAPSWMFENLEEPSDDDIFLQSNNQIKQRVIKSNHKQKIAQLFEPINPGFYTQPSQASANSANPGFSSQPSKLQCIGGKFGGNGPRFSVGVANRGGQAGGAQIGGGRAGAPRGGQAGGAPRGGGRGGAPRGGGRGGAPRAMVSWTSNAMLVILLSGAMGFDKFVVI